MKFALVILVCCLVALLPETRAAITTYREVRAPNDYEICRKELKINGPEINPAPTEEEKRACLPMCLVKKLERLEADEDVFNEEIYLKLVPRDERERMHKIVNDCKAKESESACEFVNCISDHSAD